jgi:hypothetical protein
MAGIRGRSGPPGNQNAFRHGLAGIAQRRDDGILNPAEQSIREEVLSGLLADKAGAAQTSTAMRVFAEIIASDVSLLVTFNHAIDAVIDNNPKARANPKALAQLDGYKRLLASSLSGNLNRFGMKRIGESGIASGDHRGNGIELSMPKRLGYARAVTQFSRSLQLKDCAYQQSSHKFA